jgi:hypothetical protein
MPKLNLRGEGKEDETQPVGPPPEEYPSPPPTLRDISAGEGPAWWLQILLGLLILGAITYALNHYGIVHFWGKKSPTQSTEESLPPVVQPPPVTEGQAQKPEETPTPTIKEEAVPPTAKEEQPPVAEKKEEAITPTIKEPEPKREVATTPRTGAGRYTIQVSSWPSRSDADRVVRRLGGLGFDAYVAEGFVKGRTWYRVRVGRYPTTGDAQTAAANLKSVNENGVWVTKVD